MLQSLAASAAVKHLNNALGISGQDFNTVKFLEKELSINPDDTKAADLLINKVAQGLDFAIHELPEYRLCWKLEVFAQGVDTLKLLLQKYKEGNAKWNKRLKLLYAIQITWGGYIKQKEIKLYHKYLEGLENDESSTILSWGRDKVLIYD